MQDNKPLVVGLAGFGTVGGGLCRLLRENADLVRRRCGRDIRIKTILVRNANKIREVETPAGAALVEDAAKIYADPEIDVVCELMGGIKPAKDLIDKALEHGKDIVSANKALLAEDGWACSGRPASLAAPCATRPAWPARSRSSKFSGKA